MTIGVSPVEKLLIVDDNKIVSSLLKSMISRELSVAIDTAYTLNEARRFVQARENVYFACLVDIDLPDSHGGEIVDLTVEAMIPTIIISRGVEDGVKDQYWVKNIVEFIPLERKKDSDLVCSILRRIRLNKSIKVMIVDDSRSARYKVKNLLEYHNYTVIEACNGREALELLESNPGVKLVITDFEMPVMNGVELCRELRNRKSKQELAIIGISASSNKSQATIFLRNGANDFLYKPFTNEELFCRVNHVIGTLLYIQEVNDFANIDYLTGTYNRRYFYSVAARLHQEARKHHSHMAVAMVDIDYFKKINDKYGHHAGDEVLKALGQCLKDRFGPRDVVARFGGEEFCILAVSPDCTDMFTVFDAIRREIELIDVHHDEASIKCTVSIGVCCDSSLSLDMMIETADAMLYQSKREGRNKVSLAR